MVVPGAAASSEVLPTFLEFLRGAVIVGHNIRFDCGFLDAALGARLPAAREPAGRHGRRSRAASSATTSRTCACTRSPALPHRPEPVHRAYADAAATAEVLHALLERAATFGVLGLDDLVALPKIRVHPSAAKLALTARMPRVPGVYLFRDRAAECSPSARRRTCGPRCARYFAGDDRRKVPQLLRETARIEHRVCAGPLEAAVRAERADPAAAPAVQPPSATPDRDRVPQADAARPPRPPGARARARRRATRTCSARSVERGDRAQRAARVLEPVPADTRRARCARPRCRCAMPRAAAGRSRAELGRLADAARARRTGACARRRARGSCSTGPEGRIETRGGRVVFAKATSSRCTDVERGGRGGAAARSLARAQRAPGRARRRGRASGRPSCRRIRDLSRSARGRGGVACGCSGADGVAGRAIARPNRIAKCTIAAVTQRDERAAGARPARTGSTRSRGTRRRAASGERKPSARATPNTIDEAERAPRRSTRADAQPGTAPTPACGARPCARRERSVAAVRASPPAFAGATIAAIAVAAAAGAGSGAGAAGAARNCSGTLSVRPQPLHRNAAAVDATSIGCFVPQSGHCRTGAIRWCVRFFGARPRR